MLALETSVQQHSSHRRRFSTTIVSKIVFDDDCTSERKKEEEKAFLVFLPFHHITHFVTEPAKEPHNCHVNVSTAVKNRSKLKLLVVPVDGSVFVCCASGMIMRRCTRAHSAENDGDSNRLSAVRHSQFFNSPRKHVGIVVS